MRVGSLFSGIGAGDLGLERAGFQIIAQAEIDKHCCRVLQRHWPEVPNLGDVRDIGATSFRLASGRVNYADGLRDSATHGDRTYPCDLILGGFPCQDVSVAGKRAGLHGERSGLWFEFQRILSELRPRWAIVENVPGLLSSHQGRDFATILDGLGECGFGGIAWAVLDSQHFGVAQRRRRVFIVGGPTRRGVEQVLSLCESCGGHPAPRREAREDVAGTIRSRSSRPGVNPPGRGGEDDTNVLLTVIQDARGVRDKAQNGIGVQESETMYTLDGVSQHAVAFTERTRAKGRTFESQEELAYALTNPGSGGRTHSRQLYDGMTVRRLTPVECERLQGLPDGFTCTCGANDDLPACRCADGPRYRALGNAMTMPVLEHLGRRIMAVEA